MENKPGKAKQEMRNYYRKPWKKLALPASWESAMNNLSGGYTWPPMTPILPRVIAPVVPGTCPRKPVPKLWKLGQGIHEQAASGVIVTSANPWISSFAQWSIWGNVLDGSSNTMWFFFKLSRNWTQVTYQWLEGVWHYNIQARTGRLWVLNLPFADFTYKAYLEAMFDAWWKQGVWALCVTVLF